MEKPNPRLLNSFDEYVLRAARTAARRHAGITEEMTSIATLYESYLWLDLGVKFGIYDIHAAESLMPSIFPDLGRNLESFRGWGLFPGLKERLVRATTSELNFFLFDFGDIESAARTNQFHLAIMTLARFFENRAAQALTGTLIFLDDQLWQSLIAKLPDSEQIINAMTEDYDPWADGHRNLVVAGWFPLVQHVEELMNMFDSEHPAVTGSEDAWITFKYDILRTHSWRFDFRNSELQSRFKIISAMLGQVLTKSEFRAENHLIRVDGSSVEQYVEQLIQRWMQFTRPKEVGVEA
jgi:hypothetical protein